MVARIATGMICACFLQISSAVPQDADPGLNLRLSVSGKGDLIVEGRCERVPDDGIVLVRGRPWRYEAEWPSLTLKLAVPEAAPLVRVRVRSQRFEARLPESAPGLYRVCVEFESNFQSSPAVVRRFSSGVCAPLRVEQKLASRNGVELIDRIKLAMDSLNRVADVLCAIQQELADQNVDRAAKRKRCQDTAAELANREGGCALPAACRMLKHFALVLADSAKQGTPAGDRLPGRSKDQLRGPEIDNEEPHLRDIMKGIPDGSRIMNDPPSRSPGEAPEGAEERTRPGSLRRFQTLILCEAFLMLVDWVEHWTREYGQTADEAIKARARAEIEQVKGFHEDWSAREELRGDKGSPCDLQALARFLDAAVAQVSASDASRTEGRPVSRDAFRQLYKSVQSALCSAPAR